MKKRACKVCRVIFTEDKCPICQTDRYSENWKGRLVIIDAKNSEIAKKLNIEKEGEYAVKVK